MRPPIYSLPPLAALLLAGWIIFIAPVLSWGVPATPGHSAKPATDAGTRKDEKGRVDKTSGDGEEKPFAAPESGVAPKSGDAPRAVPIVEPSATEAAEKTTSAAGGQNKPASREEEEENEQHTDAADPVANSVEQSGSQGDKDENGENLAGLVPSRDQANRAKLNAMLPPGSTHRGVYYPSFRLVRPDPEVMDPATGLPIGVNAPMDSLFRGEAVTRLDDNHVLIDKASYVQFDQADPSDAARPPRQSLSVDLEQALYDLKNDILVSHLPVRIENEQMILTGESMVHDRVSGLTELTGGVRVILFGDAGTGNGENTGATTGNSETEPAPPPVEAPAKAAGGPRAKPAAAAAPADSPATPGHPSRKPKPKAGTASSSRK